MTKFRAAVSVRFGAALCAVLFGLCALPGVSTVDEAGVPGYELSPWYGLLAPAGTSRGIVARLAAEVTKIVRAAEIRDKLAVQGAEVAGGSPDEFAAVIQADSLTWSRVVKDTGMRGE
jgi:tripartite-type tricarboxylate transporter receptor subunit TctC